MLGLEGRKNSGFRLGNSTEMENFILNEYGLERFDRQREEAGEGN